MQIELIPGCRKPTSHFGKFGFFLYLCTMRIIAFRTLKEFWEKSEYADSETSLRSWYHDAKSSDWKNSNELIPLISLF